MDLRLVILGRFGGILLTTFICFLMGHFSILVSPLKEQTQRGTRGVFWVVLGCFWILIWFLQAPCGSLWVSFWCLLFTLLAGIGVHGVASRHWLDAFFARSHLIVCCVDITFKHVSTYIWGWHTLLRRSSMSGRLGTRLVSLSTAL